MLGKKLTASLNDNPLGKKLRPPINAFGRKLIFKNLRKVGNVHEPEKPKSYLER